MRILRLALAAIASTLLIAGCGGDQQNQGGAASKPLDNPQVKSMLDEMKAHRGDTKSATP
jgi:hypothetical protein